MCILVNHPSQKHAAAAAPFLFRKGNISLGTFVLMMWGGWMGGGGLIHKVIFRNRLAAMKPVIELRSSVSVHD